MNASQEDALDGAAIRQAVADRLEPALARLESYVRHETPSGDAEALDALADVLVARYRELGAEARRAGAPTGDHVLAALPGTGPAALAAPVLLLGHHDTVWPRGTLAGPVPWRREADENGVERVHGPGAYDMKAGLVVVETALEVLAALGLPHRPLRIVSVADEEVGSPTSRRLVTEQARGVIGVFGFESPHADGGFKTARRGSTRLRLSVTGREAHAALDPEGGVSAVDELTDQLLAVRRLVADEAEAGHEVLCNVGTLAGGGRTNVVPGSAHADIGLRFIDPDTERRVLRRFQALSPVRPGARVEVEVLSNRPAWAPSEQGDRLLDEVARAAALVGQEAHGRPAAGAGDTNVTGALGVPSIDGFGPRGRGAHAVDEQFVVASFAQRIELLTALLATF